METLQIGQYKLPEGGVPAIYGGILTIRESNRKPITEPRCRDCKHMGSGHSTDSYWPTTVCFKRPKTFKVKKDNKEFYYHVTPLNKTCDLFEPKEE